jgi:hypothetical protein
MNEFQINYRAIQAACQFNLEIIKEGYGCDTMEIFTEIVEDMTAIVKAFPELDIEGIIEFYVNNQSDEGRVEI